MITQQIEEEAFAHDYTNEYGDSPEQSATIAKPRFVNDGVLDR